jgi:Tfp pilus assembly protein PilW
MAVLPDVDRNRVYRYFMRQQLGNAGFTKDQLQAAVNAIDTFLEDNATAVNNAFPATFRTSATTAQKAAVVGFVAMRRAGLLRVEEDG